MNVNCFILLCKRQHYEKDASGNNSILCLHVLRKSMCYKKYIDKSSFSFYFMLYAFFIT